MAGLLSLIWGFEVNDQPQSGWLEFLRPSGERQKHVSAFNGALATGCEAPGLYGKKPLLVTFFPGHNASGHLPGQPAMIGNRS